MGNRLVRQEAVLHPEALAEVRHWMRFHVAWNNREDDLHDGIIEWLRYGGGAAGELAHYQVRIIKFGVQQAFYRRVRQARQLPEWHVRALYAEWYMSVDERAHGAESRRREWEAARGMVGTMSRGMARRVLEGVLAGKTLLGIAQEEEVPVKRLFQALRRYLPGWERVYGACRTAMLN